MKTMGLVTTSPVVMTLQIFELREGAGTIACKGKDDFEDKGKGKQVASSWPRKKSQRGDLSAEECSKLSISRSTIFWCSVRLLTCCCKATNSAG